MTKPDVKPKKKRQAVNPTDPNLLARAIVEAAIEITSPQSKTIKDRDRDDQNLENPNQNQRNINKTSSSDIISH